MYILARSRFPEQAKNLFDNKNTRRYKKATLPDIMSR